jgi:uncharacterized protein YaaQ
MKLVIAVIQDKDRHKVVENLLEKNFKFTHVASTGGFLREGNVTFFIGVEDDEVPKAIDTLSGCCHSREQFVNVFPPTMGPIGAGIPSPVKVTVGGATVFVVDVDKFVQL